MGRVTYAGRLERSKTARWPVILFGLVALGGAPARAQEPLLIRIRPLADAEAARIAREALWLRRQAHARAVIESVCTGCLGAWAPDAEPRPIAAPVPVPVAAERRVTTMAAQMGVELDPGSGASAVPSDPSTLERHP
jgi:hypothetical protein